MALLIMVLQAGAIAASAILIGWVGLSISASREERKGSLPFVDSLFLILFAGLALYSWVGLGLAELGRFSAPALLGLGLATCPALVGYAVAHGIGLKVPVRPRVTPSSLALLMLLGWSLVAYAWPSETILGSSDAGIRVASAVNLARTGGIIYQDGLIADGGAASALVGQLDDGSGVQVRLLGFNVWDKARGLVSPQFAFLNEVWLALAFSLFGLTSLPLPSSLAQNFGWLATLGATPLALFSAPLTAVASLVAVYLFVREEFGNSTALVAALLLATNVAEIWYARVPMSEMMTQFFIFAGLYLLLSGLRLRSGYVCFLAGSSFGLALLVRVDSLLVLPPVILYLLYCWWRQPSTRRLLGWVAVPLVSLTAHYGLHYMYFSGGYLVPNLRTVARLLSTHPEWLAAGGAAVVGTLVLWRTGLGSARSAVRVRALFPRVMAGAAVLAAGYGYFIWPLVSPAHLGRDMYLNAPVDWNQGANLVKLGWYLSPLGLLLMLLGLVVVLWRPLSPGRTLFLAIAIAYSAIFLNNSMVSPTHPNWIRRFLPVVVPSVIVLEAVALRWLAGMRLKVPRFGLALSAVLLVGVLWSTLWSARVLLSERNYPGTERSVSHLVSLLPANAVIILEPGDAGQRLAVPLTYLYGRNAFTLYRQPFSDSLKLSQAEIATAVDSLLAAGHEVYYLASDGLTTIEPGRLSFVLAGEWALHTREVVERYDQLPVSSSDYNLPFWLYRIQVREAGELQPREFSLDVGGSDYGYLVSGFYRAETSPGANAAQGSTSFRWTQPVAKVRIPWPQGNTILRLSVSGHRPSGSSPLSLLVKVDGSQVDTLSLPARSSEASPPEFVEETVVVPSDVAKGADSVLLEIESPGWQAPGDGRPLGVMLDSIRVGPSHN